MNVAGGTSGSGRLILGSGDMLLQTGSNAAIAVETSRRISTFGSGVGGDLNISSNQDLNFGNILARGHINVSTDLNMALYGLMKGGDITLSSVLEFKQKFVGLALQTTSGNLNLTAGQILSDDVALQLNVYGDVILNTSGRVDLNAFGHLNLSSSSDLTLGKITSSGPIAIRSTASLLGAVDNLIETPSNVLFDVSGDIGTTNPLILGVGGKLKIANARSSNIQSGYLLSIDSIESSGNTKIETTLGAKMVVDGITQSLSGGISLKSNGALEIHAGAPISASGDISLESQDSLILPEIIVAGQGGNGSLIVKSMGGSVQALSSLTSHGDMVWSGMGNMKLPPSIVTNGGNFLVQMQGGILT